MKRKTAVVDAAITSVEVALENALILSGDVGAHDDLITQFENAQDDAKVVRQFINDSTAETLAVLESEYEAAQTDLETATILAVARGLALDEALIRALVTEGWEV